MKEIKKYTCKCKSCNREFDEEEYQITQDENKCIFHCEKTNWEKLDEKEIDIRQQKFNVAFLEYCSNSKDGEIKDFHFYDVVNLLKEINNKKFFFRQCHFHGLFSFDNYLEEHIFFLDNCFFYNGVDFLWDINSEFHFVNSCQFNNTFINLSGFFSKKLSFIGSYDINEINCNSVVFKDDVVLSNLIVKNYADFQFTKFYKNCSFFQSKFCSTVNFHETNFIGNVNFLLFSSKDKLDLSNTVFEGQTNFLKVNITIKNRETARIIKDSFEQQNNIIEANKFYALEMKEREKELSSKKDFFEWLVFKTHGLVSNHSQDWILALFWIISLTFITSFIKIIDSNISQLTEKIVLSFIVTAIVFFININISNTKKIYYIICSLVYYFLYSIFTKDCTLNIFSNTLNPFSIMTGKEELSFGILLYKITIAYLIYQLIISIRQNTRRK